MGEIGILCLELRIAPRAASNYAMLNLKFQKDQSSKFKIISYIIAFQTVLKILITLFEQNKKLSHSDISSIVLAGCRS